jgi:hypothetical protein
MVVPVVDKTNRKIAYEIKQGPFSKDEIEAGRNGTKAAKGQDFMPAFWDSDPARLYPERRKKRGAWANN